MTLHLACTTEGGYAPHTGTMLHSALSTMGRAPVHVHLLTTDLCAADSAALRELTQRFGATLDIVTLPDSAVTPFPSKRFHRSCWYRILLPDVLSNVDKVLYLDSDIIVRASLLPLWQTNLDGRPMAAVINPFYPFFPDYHVSHLGLPRGSPYFNSGVLLMNLAHLRSIGFTDAVRAYAARHVDNLYPEQDAINALYQEQIVPLHPRWNAQSTLFELRDRQLPFPRDVASAARRDPAIVHFIGPYKPWVYLCTHPLRRLYDMHRAQTPWPPEPPVGRTWKNRLLRPLPVAWRHRLAQIENAIRRRWRKLRPSPAAGRVL